MEDSCLITLKWTMGYACFNSQYFYSYEYKNVVDIYIINYFICGISEYICE